MRLKRVMMIAIVGGLAGLLQTGAALAQQEDPIAPFVIDVRGAFMSLDAAGSAFPLGLDKAQLPYRGLGLELGAHVYPLRGRVVSLGVGASLLFVRSSRKRRRSRRIRSRIRPTRPCGRASRAFRHKCRSISGRAAATATSAAASAP